MKEAMHRAIAAPKLLIRYELIDPVLRDKAYRVPYIRLETPAPAEPTAQTQRAGQNRVSTLC
jgi:hypothetical protein